MKTIPEKIIDKVFDKFFNNIFFPFTWGKETLKLLNYYQRKEEEKLLRTFNEIKNFQAWISNNQNILDVFIRMLNEIKDLREIFLIKSREFKEELEVLYLWNNIISFIEKNKIPLASELLNFPNEKIGFQNLLWEILSWYLKVSKFITFSLNFYNFPNLNSGFYFEGNKVYQPSKYYILEEEKDFLVNLLINLSGFPSREGIKEFSLPQRIIIKRSKRDYFFLDSKNLSLIFYLS
ncbi:MAG: DNA repair protein Rad50 [Dictyoglomus sp.]|nr:DNA repair protein Rad50 [Dictyoglomus sp.]MCX7941613.1 DNA repair protein Rad50 [Dictyoglomaceae bacterium]MDW8187768.1 DNA repair protein Rad50 [Dictyoglomus sp.]